MRRSAAHDESTMSHQPNVYFDLVDTADPAFDVPIEAMLVALLAAGPLTMGAVQTWSETIVSALALATGVTLAVKLLRRPDVPFVRSRAYWPAVAFIALVAIQLVPLPSVLVKLISPHTWTVKSDLLGELPDAAHRLRWMTLSFYPEETLRQLKLVVAMSIVFVVVVNTIRRASQVRRLLGIIAGIGAAFALLALAQDIYGAENIYFIVPNRGGYTVRGGPFANRNHFGQFMNLCIGAASGLALVFVNQHFRRDNYSPEEVRAKLRMDTFRPAWFLLATIVLGLGAVCLSRSRGAMLSAAVAGTVIAIVLVTRRGAHGRGWIVGAIVVCVVAIALLDYQGIMKRLTTETGDKLTGHRVELLRDMSVAWKDYPVLGTGLGTHATMFGTYDRSDYPYLATHAENEYAQVMTETGAVGLLIAIAFVGLVTAALVRAVRGAMSPASSAALGLGYGWLAILIQSGTDFGQHAPANAALTAVTCALMLNLSELRARELDAVSSELPRRGRLWTRIAGVVVTAALTVAIVWDDAYAWAADETWSVVQRIDADLQRKNWDAENAEYVDVLEAAEKAARLRPRNIEYHYGLNFYRWKAIARARDPNTGELVFLDPLPQHAARIVDELHSGRWLAPTHGATYLLAGQIERTVLDRKQEGRRHIERAVMLSGADPMAAFVAGEVAAVDGDIDASLKYLRRAAQLAPNLRVDVADVYFRTLKRPELALEVAGDDLEALHLLIARLEAIKTPEADALRARAAQHAFDVLSRRADEPDAPGDIVARFAAELVRRDQVERALPYYQRALRMEYGQTEWRMGLAKAYEKLGRDADALREAESCLRLRPQMAEALEMTARLKKKADSAATTRGKGGQGSAP